MKTRGQQTNSHNTSIQNGGDGNENSENRGKTSPAARYNSYIQNQKTRHLENARSDTRNVARWSECCRAHERAAHGP